ncbi:hypothetical protein TNCV_2580281 [Trichonephila clavipes]|uniref:Tc1-like transposase DDE domain-containing protein n=1 Tax=Trichonephila clavipes TaxID=2585209 RepID=A0A8X6S967_TRICX|nr:hypothetical protein TNCV_2580281 [Trichonephila clavipes]
MEWPACSPDMNPLEHVWDVLRRRVAGHQPPKLSKNWKELFWKSGKSSSGRATLAMVAEWPRYRIVVGLVTSSSPVPLKAWLTPAELWCACSRAIYLSSAGVVLTRPPVPSTTHSSSFK